MVLGEDGPGGDGPGDGGPTGGAGRLGLELAATQVLSTLEEIKPPSSMDLFV